MNVRRYTARDMRDAMRQVRERQGPDAVILSSRRVDGMLEVVAGLAEDPAAASAESAEPELAAVRRELCDLRQLIARQQAASEATQWNARHPLAAECVTRLLDCGFNDKTARGLASGIAEDSTPEQAWARLRARLSASLAAAPINRLEDGGMLALVGPTGVGKTTTLARLALRQIKRLGRDAVTLVTLDRQRIGAWRQLQTFGQMAGVPVMLLEQERELLTLAKQAESGRLVLIDTAGQTARDAAARAPFAQLRGQIALETWLVIAATHQAGVLRQVLQAFQGAEPTALVLTKVDESEQLGETLSVLLEQRLGLAFHSDGQRIAEDFHRIDTEALTRLALGERARTSFGQPEPRLDWAGAAARLEIRSQPRPARIPVPDAAAPLVLESVLPLRTRAHVHCQ